MASKMFVCFAIFALATIAFAAESAPANDRVKKNVLASDLVGALPYNYGYAAPYSYGYATPYSYGYATPYSYASYNSYPYGHSAYNYPMARSVYSGYYPHSYGYYPYAY
ncbi:prisilkin-39-like [Daktulosphaira vitifoliae]|uniref:prisilkin-39-like n=1 Tax=Daktulosphaira vitifoliae TaxID=58002 RepID=UPI0021A98DD5|nr:prisilkin-39-like [Daktulosphaira vitifoliae]